MRAATESLRRMFTGGPVYSFSPRLAGSPDAVRHTQGWTAGSLAVSFATNGRLGSGMPPAERTRWPAQV
jgi:hypothetical protein